MAETNSELTMAAFARFLAERFEFADARRRIEEGIADDRDFYVSPFAPNPYRTGPVGPGGSGFGVAPALVGDEAFVLPPPETRDRMVVTPEVLRRFLIQALMGYT